MTASTAPMRTALIAIHGVGDPLPGATATEVAKLLVGRQQYAHHGAAPWVVPVTEVDPGSTAVAPSDSRFRYSSPFVGARLGSAKHAMTPGEDLGLQLNAHLLAGTALEDDEKTYTAERHVLKKGARQVDVIDMYWGDLSGLAKSPGRIATELFTLLFHLCQLGRDAAHHTAIYMDRHHAQHATAATWFARCHEAADAAFTKVNGMLNALLVCLALWWLPLYGALQNEEVFACLHVEQAWAHGAALAWLLAIAFVFSRFARYCDGVVRGSRRWAAWLGAAALVGAGAGLGRVSGGGLRELWAGPALGALEGLMAVLLLAWAVMALAAAGLALWGWHLKRQCQNPVVTQGIDTGRIGLLGSTTLFVSLVSAAWALALSTVSASFEGLSYRPFLIGSAHDAAVLVQSYFDHSTVMFCVVALVLLLLGVGAVVTLAPSIGMELRTPPAGANGQSRGARLSRWGQRLTRSASYTAVAGALAFFAWALWAIYDAMSPGAGAVLSSFLTRVSACLLQPLTYAVAGSALGLLALGSRVFGALGTIRIALDAALDVDKHFREFPENATPRGRIAARFLSLLRAAQRDGYDRIVVASHSQGTIIVAELLRYLQATRPKELKALPEIHLLTCGSPLRQLYAARFPALYSHWVESPLVSGSTTTGPRADALGVARWTNAYCTGDYVGRWLWEPSGKNLLDTGASLDDEVHRQICLGQGAHTHYYDARMAVMAGEIERLLT